MGVMTNPRTLAVVSKLVLKLHIPLSFLLYIAAIVVMIGLAIRPFNAGTYFSENALLPGLVEKEYTSVGDVTMYTDLIQQVSQDSDDIPAEWIKNQFLEIGLETFVQNFSANHPFLSPGDRITGTNVFAILRAPRIAGTEAMVFMVPYHVSKSGSEGSVNGGVGLMFSLAKHFIQKSYWSKDIIFLVVDKEEIGSQAWVEAYHDVPGDYITSSTMHGRSGAILAAINLDIPSKFISHIDVKIEGLNGQLPNLDLFNLAIRLCAKERLNPTFQNRKDPHLSRLQSPDGIRHTTETMVSNMLHQATGRPNGIHGLFLRYGIQALTLQGIEGSNSRNNLKEIGLVIEGMFRSVNNILERFHQSFFFYVLPQTDRYVSIGMYMISLGMLLVIPTLNGLALWFKTTEDTNDAKGSNNQKRPHHRVIPIIIASHIAGILLYLAPEFFVSRISSFVGLTEMDALKVGLGAFFVGCLTIPQPQTSNKASDWMLLKCYTLVWHAIILLAISMMNFSLSFVVAVITIPVFILVKPCQNIVWRSINKIALLLVSPPAVLFMMILFYSVNFNGQSFSLETVYNACIASADAISQSVVDQYLFQNWSFALASLVLFPSWFLVWICF